MAFSARAVTVPATAGGIRLDSDETDNVSGRTLDVYNNGAATIYLGGSSAVTTAAGRPLAAGESYAVDLDTGEHLYGIVASGTVEARVAERGL